MFTAIRTFAVSEFIFVHTVTSLFYCIIVFGTSFSQIIRIKEQIVCRIEAIISITHLGRICKCLGIKTAALEVRLFNYFIFYYASPATIAMYATPRIIIAARAKQKTLMSFLRLDSIILHLPISQF